MSATLIALAVIVIENVRSIELTPHSWELDAQPWPVPAMSCLQSCTTTTTPDRVQRCELLLDRRSISDSSQGCECTLKVPIEVGACGRARSRLSVGSLGMKWFGPGHSCASKFQFQGPRGRLDGMHVLN
ncbi:hypothetical protein BC826DRAFT_326058 [Russula brevipes]|nr:hypothetical protein BC826DRAFT_326058 [Russula brevipes]